jgi:hypothetical protein
LCFERNSGFQECAGLEVAEIPATVEIIKGCSESAVKRIAFSENCAVKEIDGFENCPQFEQINIPQTVIHLQGFHRCLRLQKLEIPASVAVIQGFND